MISSIGSWRGDDRWRLPIFLGVGHAVSEGLLAAPYQLLSRLLHARGREEAQRQRDLIFAAELAEDIGWERLERGVDRRPYPWGADEPDGERANYNKIDRATTTVGCFPQGATPEGVLDLAGNVWEWTRSFYTNYPYDPDDGREDVDEPAEKHFALRGGGWDDRSFYLGASSRNRYAPTDYGSDVGFRLARHLPTGSLKR